MKLTGRDKKPGLWFMNESYDDLYHDWNLHQEIEIIDGSFEGFTGVIYFMDRRKKILRVKINFYGRDTPVELSFDQIKPLE
jgi:transcription antitermination factor NusG